MASRTVTIRIGEALFRAVQERASAEGVSVSEWIRRAVEAYFDHVSVDRLDEVERRLARLEDVAGL